ncbi:hypothetical protein D3C80_1989860 [compost metagenome]
MDVRREEIMISTAGGILGGVVSGDLGGLVGAATGAYKPPSLLTNVHEIELKLFSLPSGKLEEIVTTLPIHARLVLVPTTEARHFELDKYPKKE